MLSKDEEHELARLEESLGDSAWRRLWRGVEAPVWPHRWKLRLLVPFGVLVTTCGVVTGSDDLVNQGVLVTVATTGYWAIRFMASRPQPPPARGAGRGPRGAGRSDPS